jgi:membrane protein implicated in regulation of membrane protease activity
VSSGNGTNPARHRSRRPYRDSALAYGGLGALVAVVAYATGSGLLRSLIGGFAAFALATAYTWWRMRSRERSAGRQAP